MATSIAFQRRPARLAWPAAIAAAGLTAILVAFNYWTTNPAGPASSWPALASQHDAPDLGDFQGPTYLVPGANTEEGATMIDVVRSTRPLGNADEGSLLVLRSCYRLSTELPSVRTLEYTVGAAWDLLLRKVASPPSTGEVEKGTPIKPHSSRRTDLFSADLA